jgi:peroxiredoxin Q/BCP
MAITKGKAAPPFSLPGVDAKGTERVHTLEEYKGKRLILYFYPRDSTPGCTREALDFSAESAKIERAGAVVLGVSPNSIAAHVKFIEAQGIKFPLLVDADKKIAEKYGAYGEKKMYGKTSMGIIRSTFLIDEKGRVERIWTKVKVAGHVEEVLGAL